MREVDVAPIYVPFVRFSGVCDRLQHYEVRYPSHALIKAVFVPSGAGGPEPNITGPPLSWTRTIS